MLDAVCYTRHYLHKGCINPSDIFFESRNFYLPQFLFVLMSHLRYHIRYLFVRIILLSMAGVFTLPALAGELRRPVQGIRNLGMGNTGIALSFDENALFYNPAGLATVDSMIVSLPLLLEISDDAWNIRNEVSKLGSAKTSEAVDLLMGNRVHFRGLLDLNFLMPFGELMAIGLAGVRETMFDIEVRNPVAVEIDFGWRYDEIYNMGFGMPVARGRWLVGAGIETVQRCDIPLTTHTIGTILANTELSSSVGSCNINTDLTRAQTFNFGF